MKLLLAALTIVIIPVASSRESLDDPLHRAQRGAVAHDTLLAALGEATVSCRGSVSTAVYRVSSAGILERAFDVCTTRHTRALGQIDNGLCAVFQAMLCGAGSH